MARLTSDNDSKDVYLPYKSSEQTIREAIDEHESRFSVYGWIAAFLFVVHDILILTLVYTHVNH